MTRRMRLRPRSAGPRAGTVRDAGEFVAALPALLGFHPQASLVVAGLGDPGRRVGLVMRSDLPPEPLHGAGPDPGPPGAQLHRFVAHLVSTLQRSGPESAIIAVIGGSVGGGTASSDPPPGPLPWHDLVALVTEQLEAAEMTLHTAVWAAGTRPGDRWACYQECRCDGTVPGDSATAFAAGAALNGTVVHAGRDELTRIVAPIDAEVLSRREAMIEQEIDALAGTDLVTEERPLASTALSAVSDALADAAAGRLVLDDHRVVELAVALGTPEVRQAALRHVALLAAAGPDDDPPAGVERERAAAEQLWAALARETPAPEAAEAASMLAVSALLRGDGALANVALDRAGEAWPGHLLSRQLRAAAALGMRPEQLRAALLDRSGEDG
ncbi:MAG: DUF4192 domain-containing protein [Pseudonocardia sp.]|nr:DUF4192 domain-containing protein [Pseudonocardia sp.]